MNFDELKLIWGAQDEEPLYAINQEALHASVKKKGRSFRRHILRRDMREIGVGLASAAYLICEGVLLHLGKPGLALTASNENSWANQPYWFYLAAVLVAMGPVWMLFGRRRHASRERGFEQTLNGDLAKAISQIEYQIELYRESFRRVLLPMFSGCLFYLLLVIYLEDAPKELIFTFLLVPVGLAFSVWGNRRCVRKSLLPKKRDLEALRDTLTVKK